MIMQKPNQKADAIIYFAVIGDLVASRSIPAREVFQKQFSQILTEVNEHFKPSIASRFTVTVGDEFQGLLGKATQICHIMDTIITRLYPVKVRFGIGIGAMSTEIDPVKSLGADGPAYWAARKAIEFIHENNDYGTSRTCLYTSDPSQSHLINAALAANGLILDGWRGTQLAVLKALVDSDLYGDDFEQVKLAEYMKLTPASLQKRIKGSGVKVYIRNGMAISEAIDHLGKQA
jgi:hypothetical protein